MATKYWTRVIERAKERKKAGKEPFTDLQITRATEFSSWPTCACGRQDPRIPRDGWGRPFDAELRDFGCQFGGAVSTGEPEKAENLLARIEKRAAEVLREVVRSAS